MLHIEGVETSAEDLHGCQVTTVHVQSEQAAKALRRPVGAYITIETGQPLSEHDHIMNVGICLATVLHRMLRPHYHKKLCVCGLGNRNIPADALGPEVIRNLPLKTLSEYRLEGNFREVVSLEPGTAGISNINTEALVSGVAKAVRADCLLLIDSLTAKKPAQMFRSVQLSNRGGLSAHRIGQRVDWSALGIPVVSLGVPMAFSVAARLPDHNWGSRLFTGVEVQSEIAAAGRIIAYAILRLCFPWLSMGECFLMSGLNSDPVPFDLAAWDA